VVRVCAAADSVYGGPDGRKYGIAGLVFMALIVAPVFRNINGQQLQFCLKDLSNNHPT
jgi:hypothetical protein